MPTFSDEQLEKLEQLLLHGARTARELAEALGVKVLTVRRMIRRMIRDGVAVTAVDSPPTGRRGKPPKRWGLA
jgi:predicted ArsR family transcriptional regulator